ncbi:hypothetical protein AVEN_207272-1 [Araneus ventricosus]|uniref:Uncharacterized protein n=1 Tax=Araneus ventricosus TaxID=182803 RepID=A0A4Y2ICH7_ARAVE|nr:hypothetical protein AVEN_207272-1 [Araneus ventricosus]
MLNSKRRFPDLKPDFIEIRPVIELGHVKSDVEGLRFETLLHQSIVIVIARYMLNRRRRFQIRNRFHQKSVFVHEPDSKPDFIRDPSYGARYMLNLTSKVPDSKPDFIRDPSCIEPGYVKSDVEGSSFGNLISSEIRFVLSRVHVKSGLEGSRFETRFHQRSVLS